MTYDPVIATDPIRTNTCICSICNKSYYFDNLDDNVTMENYILTLVMEPKLSTHHFGIIVVPGIIIVDSCPPSITAHFNSSLIADITIHQLHTAIIAIWKLCILCREELVYIHENHGMCKRFVEMTCGHLIKVWTMQAWKRLVGQNVMTKSSMYDCWFHTIFVIFV